MFQRNIVREVQNTNFVFSIFFFFRNRAVYEIMWKNIVEQGRPQMTIWRMRFVFCISKATNTDTQIMEKLTDFPQQQWLHERLSVFHYTYIAGLVIHYLAACSSLHTPPYTCQFEDSHRNHTDPILSFMLPQPVYSSFPSLLSDIPVISDIAFL